MSLRSATEILKNWIVGLKYFAHNYNNNTQETENCQIEKFLSFFYEMKQSFLHDFVLKS